MAFEFYRGKQSLIEYFKSLYYYFVIFGVICTLAIISFVFVIPFACVPWFCVRCKKDLTRSDYRK